MRFAKLRSKRLGKDVLHMWIEDDCEGGDLAITFMKNLKENVEDYEMRVDTYQKLPPSTESAQKPMLVFEGKNKT